MLEKPITSLPKPLESSYPPDCPNCGAIYNGKTAFHKFECPKNRLGLLEWEKKSNERDEELINRLLQMSFNDEKAKKMEILEIIRFLEDKILSKMGLRTLEYSVLDRAISILEGIKKEETAFSV